MTAPAYEFIDTDRLLADLARDDPAAIAYAYRATYGSTVGRFVLVHMLHEAGVGQRRDPRMGELERAHLDGAADHALGILETAGFGSHSAALFLAVNRLEGQDHDRHDEQRRDDPDERRFSGADEHPERDPG